MMKRLLWWCICFLVVGSPPVVAGGWWSVAGTNTFGDTSRSTQAPAATPANHQPPATSHLRCTDSSPICLQTLGDLAVQNNREIAILEQAIKLQQKKLWTSWLNADGLNPLAMGLRIARNMAGGGERAAAKLELAQRAARRAELETNLRQAILQTILSYENAQQQLRLTQARYTAQQARVHLLEISYRLGAGNTEQMLREWEHLDELPDAILTAERFVKQMLHQLEVIVYTSGPRP